MRVDASEKLAAAYLASCGFTDIRYEPDGNVPPDFLCDGRVAVEVRRLNQNHDDGSGPKGLEETAIPLQRRVRKLLLSLGPPTHGQSWFVFYKFKRPLPTWRALGPLIERELRAFIAAAIPVPFDKPLGNGFRLGVFRTSEPRATFFVPAGHSDQESGGFVVAELEANLKLCVAQKTKKIAKIRGKYPEWWLVLPDHIGYGLDGFDKQQFRAQVTLNHSFNKIVLLDPRDHTRAFEL